MQNRLLEKIVFDKKVFPDAFCACTERYTQTYQAHNPLHYHSCLEIGMCISGSGVEFIGDDIYPFSRDCLTVIQKNCIHDAHIVMKDPDDAPSEWIFIFADLDALGVSFHSKRSAVMNDPDMTKLFLMMFDELESKPAGYQTVFTLLLQAFLTKLCRTVPVENETDPKPQLNEQIIHAINYIAQYYPCDLSVGELAKSCNMSVSYFRKRFLEAVGSSQLEYLNNLRVSVAHQLLCTTELPILRISEEVGFRSLSSFNRMFKRTYGISPRQARNSGTADRA